MAIMKESVNSLRLYFIIVALINAYYGVSYLYSSQGYIIVLIFGFISIGFSITFFYLGILLNKLLIESTKLITTIFFFNIGFIGLVALLEILAGLPEGLIRLVGGILITWYLLSNVKRLSLEQQSKN